MRRCGPEVYVLIQRLHKDKAIKDKVQQMCPRDVCSLLGAQAVSSTSVNLHCSPHWVLFAF